MNNLTQTITGEIVEIINGVLVCANDRTNWAIITDWTRQQDWYNFSCQVEIVNGKIHFEMPEVLPVHHLESLLEHFENWKECLRCQGTGIYWNEADGFNALKCCPDCMKKAFLN